MRMQAEPEGLIRRMLAGDRTSFDDVVRWYAEDVFRLCYSLLWNREESEDVLQEVLLRLVKHVNAGRFRSANGSIKGFLMRAARNLCIDRLRKRQTFYKHTEGVRTLDRVLKRIRRPDETAQDSEIERAFEKGLSELTDLQRTVLVLHDLRGEAFEDIAKTLEISVNAVRANICRARKKMRVPLAPYVSETC